MRIIIFFLFFITRTIAQSFMRNFHHHSPNDNRCTYLTTRRKKNRCTLIKSIKRNKKIRPVRMKIPLVLIRSKYQRKLPLARELFLVASREIEQIYSNLSNLFPICLICTDLYDFCPLGHSFFSHHIATYREHHFQS